MVSEVRDKLFESDHLVVQTVFAVNTGVAPRATRSKVYNYKRADFAGLKRALSLLPWDLLHCLDVDAAVMLFYDFSFAAINDYVPMITLRNTFPPWFDRTVRELLRAKERVAASRRIRSCRNGPEWPNIGGWETLAKPTWQPKVGSSDSGDTALERRG